jgi:hypothetical protein
MWYYLEGTNVVKMRDHLRTKAAGKKAAAAGKNKKVRL